jgi:hypothetical protein
MLHELVGWALAPPVVVGDAGYGDNAEFRDGLTTRGWVYVVQVSGDLTAHGQDALPEVKAYSGRGRRLLPRYRTPPVGLREHVLTAGRDPVRQVTWREGSRGPMTSHFVALQVRPAGRRVTARQGVDGSLPAVRLLADLEPAGQRGATDESACTPGTDPGMLITVGCRRNTDLTCENTD